MWTRVTSKKRVEEKKKLNGEEIYFCISWNVVCVYWAVSAEVEFFAVLVCPARAATQQQQQQKIVEKKKKKFCEMKTARETRTVLIRHVANAKIRKM